MLFVNYITKKEKQTFSYSHFLYLETVGHPSKSHSFMLGTEAAKVDRAQPSSKKKNNTLE